MNEHNASCTCDCQLPDQSRRDIRTRSPVLAELEKAGKIKIVGAMYNIGSGEVAFYDIKN